MNIQLLEPLDFPATALARLEQIGTVVRGPLPTSTDKVEAVFVRLASFLGPEFHKRYPALRWIVSPTTGLNHIDVEYFTDQGVGVLSLRGRTEFLDTIRATAEHTIALLLSLLRKIPSADRDVRAGNWNRYPHKGRELHGKTVLIFGYGRIGRQVEALYRAFGCNVVAHDVKAERVPPEIRRTPMDILPDVDILSIHLPLNEDTKGLIDATILSALPSRAVVVNTARGEVMDQDWLISAIANGRLAGAGLDVLQGEPDPLTSDLHARIEALGDRLVLTPHIGGFTPESLEAVEEFMTDVFINSLDD